MSALKIGELFAGYGGLGSGVREVLGGEIAWFSEFDPAPSKILAHHWPTVPNHGDITKIDWSTVEPVDILTGGFPCQDVSLAGARAGLKDGTRSGLWSEFARAIAHLQPRMVVIENVRGLLSATAGGSMEPDPWGVGDGATRPVINALGAVLGDLANLGYDAEWCGIRAADAGAPHGRYRVFILATKDAHFAAGGQRWEPAPGQTEGGPTLADSGRRGGASAADTISARAGVHFGSGRQIGESSGTRSATLVPPGNRETPAEGSEPGDSQPFGGFWGVYEPAIRRWETVTGRIAPAPTNSDGKKGSHRLSARFVEWMMGLDDGHVTNPAIGLTRNEQLKALGNGVVPQQAALALRVLLERRTA